MQPPAPRLVPSRWELTTGTMRGTTQGIWVLKVRFPWLVPRGEVLAVAQCSASVLASSLWRWRATLQNGESRASFQLGMQTSGCLQNDFSHSSAAGRSCETSWLNRAWADLVRAASRGRGTAGDLLPGKQSPLQGGEDSLTPALPIHPLVLMTCEVDARFLISGI